jgi:hypothetical protein
VKTFSGQLGQTTDQTTGTTIPGIDWGAPSTATHAAGTSSLTYDVQDGLYYVWVDGQAGVKTTRTKYEQNSFNLIPGWNALNDALVKDMTYQWQEIFFTDQRPLLLSEVLTCAAGYGCTIYGETSPTSTSSPAVRSRPSSGQPAVAGCARRPSTC